MPVRLLKVVSLVATTSDLHTKMAAQMFLNVR